MTNYGFNGLRAENYFSVTVFHNQFGNGRRSQFADRVHSLALPGDVAVNLSVVNKDINVFHAVVVVGYGEAHKFGAAAVPHIQVFSLI